MKITRSQKTKRQVQAAIDWVPFTQIEFPECDPRLTNEFVSELLESIDSLGLLQPFVLRKLRRIDGEVRYSILEGRARYLCCLCRRPHNVPAVVFKMTDKQAAAYAAEKSRIEYEMLREEIHLALEEEFASPNPRLRRCESDADLIEINPNFIDPEKKRTVQ